MRCEKCQECLFTIRGVSFCYACLIRQEHIDKAYYWRRFMLKLKYGERYGEKQLDAVSFKALVDALKKWKNRSAESAA